MKYLYILKTGNTFDNTKYNYGDFEDWIIRELKTPSKYIKTIDVKNNQTLPKLVSAKGFIITGSHSMVSEELNWSLKLEEYIRKIKQANIPLLGICYGHQLIAKALGGCSNYNKNGKEIGSVKIRQLSTAKKDLLFKDLPLKFYAHETHYQSAIKLPKGSIVLAKNSHEKHQAVRFSNCIWGVQFHPEFNITVMKEYIVKQKESLDNLGIDINNLLKNVKNCSVSSKVLNNFEKIVK
ncbi:glutamine amidotransferase [Arcobacter arenosus]|uniref:glutamine amidotransferase n=1 Tax=Arcobacter arenosus TaxID=2576037 RepID=UPI003BAC2DF8